MEEFFKKLYQKDKNSFYKELEIDLKKKHKRFIVTANPETFMIGTKDNDFEKLLLNDETTIVPDGIGICMAAKKLGYNDLKRIPGIEIMEQLLKIGNKNKLSVYFLGSKKEVLETMVDKLINTYPNLNIVGYTDGYVKDYDAVFNKIVKLKPDIVLVALGIPAQEKLIYKHLAKFDKGIFVGVGGSFDVISGMKKRAPKIFIKLNLEWLYRIIKEPKRLKRFYNNNIKFLFKVKKKPKMK